MTEVWWTDDEAKWEEAWAEALRGMPDARIPLRRFGAGDCRCEGHLVHLPERPDVDSFSGRVGVTKNGYSIRSAEAAQLVSE